MIAYNYDASGRYINETDEDPNHLPVNCTLIPPPEELPGHYLAFAEGEWHQIKDSKYGDLIIQLEDLEKYWVESKSWPVLYKPFDYEEQALFEASKETIWSTMDYCAMLGVPDNQPIPMNGGKWDTIEPGYGLPFKVKDLKGLWMAIYERGMTNYGVYIYHQQFMKALYIDPLSTKEELKAYNHKAGWHINKV